MQILLACAKTMNSAASCSAVPFVTEPAFAADARRFAAELAQWTPAELAASLHCSTAIAAQNVLRYQAFANPGEQLPAVLAYNGQAYKHLRAQEFAAADHEWAQRHLFITSFLWGLLRPLDQIHPYRLEGHVALDAAGGLSMMEFWRPRLTQMLVDAVRADDGVLVHLATAEMEHLFDWRRVRREVRVVQPLFMQDQGHRLRALAVHAKSCRGAMARDIIARRLTGVEQLAGFAHLGYSLRDTDGDKLLFVAPK